MSKIKLDRINIHDAATGDIRAFGEQEAGLKFQEGAGRDFMVHSIFDAMGWDAYKPEEESTHVIISLPIKADDKNPYQGGLNGDMFSIKRGVDTKIPIGYYNTMIDAAAAKFSLMPLGKDGALADNTEVRKPIPYGSLDMRVISFINEGKVGEVKATTKAKPNSEEAA